MEIKSEKSRSNKNKKCGYAEVFYLDVLETINKHIEGICNYFISRTTNGVMSGFNNKNREIIRRSFGLKNFDNLRSRLLAGAEYGVSRTYEVQIGWIETLSQREFPNLPSVPRQSKSCHI